MSATSQDPFPDLHQKMSKKIAQLTKVIYQLNTRNEDHQSEIECITHNHHHETQRLMSDAATKIRKFKDLMDIRKVADALESRIEKLLKNHELEKQNALQDFEAYKIRAIDIAQRTTRDYQTKFELQADSIVKINLGYQEKLSTFELCNKDLSNSLESLKTNGRLHLDEVRKRFDSEKLDLNSSMNRMMERNQAEHIKLQELLRIEHEENLAVALRDMEEKMKAEASQTLGLTRAQLAGDRQEALMALKREFDENLNAQNDKQSDILERIRAELAAKAAECEKLVMEKNMLSEKLTSTRDAEIRQMCVEEDVRLQNLGELKSQLLLATENNEVLKEILNERDESCRRLEIQLREKSEAASRLQAVCAALEGDVEQLNCEILRSAACSMSAEKGFKERMAAGDRESNGLRSEVNQMASNLAQLREDLKTSDKALQRNVADSTRALSALKGEKQQLQLQLEDANNSLSNTGTRASSDIAVMTKRIEDSNVEAAGVMRAVEEAHQSALHALREKQITALDAERAVLENFKAVSILKEAQLQAEIISVRSKGAESAQALLEDHRKDLADMRLQHTAAMANINDALAAANKQVAETAFLLNGERGAMQAEMSRLERQSSSLVSDLGTRTGENLLLDGLVVSLKSQVETLREELTSTQRAYREQMEISRSELDDQWEEKMNALRDSQSRNLENAFIACRKSHSAEVLELNAKFDREKKSLEGSLVRISSEASADSARHQRDLVFAMENLQAEKDSHSLSVMRLNQQNEADRNELEQRLRTELETHLASAQATAEEKERLACEGHDAVISLMKDMCKKALDDHTVALTASDTAARLSREETMKEERTRASAEISDATKYLQKQHHDVVAALRNEHNSAVYCWENEREMMSHEIKILKESIKEAAGGLEEMKAGSAGREKLLMDMVETIRRENLVNMEDEKSRVERTLSLAAERASSSEADMKAAFKEECLKYESHLEISRSSLEALDIRWRNRESRPEDVRRIRLLESECASKDDLVAKTREEMIYFKREMLNREENFNQKFGRSPVVGVMQVVRPKDSGFGGLSTSDSGTKPLKPSASTGGFGGVRSSKPTYSVGVGGNNTGMETGLGSSGLGNGSAPGSLSSSLSNAEVSLKVRNDPGRRSFS